MPDRPFIRSAHMEDAQSIDHLIRTAFAGTDFGYQGEAELVGMLTADGDTTISLVAEDKQRIVGHVLFSRMDVEGDGVSLPGAGLAPVSVLPEYQGQGVGGALIRAGLDSLRLQDIAISFVLGDETYYSRFGYNMDLAARFASPFAGSHFMAMMLDSEAKWPQGGRAEYAPAFGRLG